MRTFIIFLLNLCLCLMSRIHSCTGSERFLSKQYLKTIFEWNLLDFQFPTPNDRQEALQNGHLIPENAIPIDVQPFYNGRDYKLKVFTTVPRFQTGIPFSLATVEGSGGSKNPVVQAYPSYEWHSSHGSNCDGITSAFRVAINECNQMWVIDSGVIGSTQHCPPQLLLFDLNTDQLLHRYRFPETVYTPIASLMITPVVSVRDPPPKGNCRRSIVYVADVSFHGLVVYDQEQNSAWRVENKFMYPDPDFGTHTIAGTSFDLMDGIFGMSTDNTYLYFHPLASRSEYAIDLKTLNNREIWLENAGAKPEAFKQMGMRDRACAAEAVDSLGNVYCVTFDPIRLISWSTRRTFNPASIRTILKDCELLQFVSGMKVVKDSNGREELWLISNRFQKIATGTLHASEINFRIIKININQNLTPHNDRTNVLIFN